MTVDWTKPGSPVSSWFSVNECLYLPSWPFQRMATEADGLNDQIKNSLYALCQKMDHIRDFFACPIIVDCCYRPPAYSKLVGGSETDVHTKGEAMDFIIENIDATKVKELILPSLDSLGVRMENNPGSDYVHIDIHPPGITGRFFTP